MNKTAIKNFSIWARNKLIDDIRYSAGLLGITEEGIQTALPQSTKDTEFYDIGTGSPYSISGEAVSQRRKLVEAIREKERKSDYPTAYKYIMEEVAYTWFNRLIAIRFMEVNNYLPSHIRVLSSDSGKSEPDLVTNPFDAELPFSADEEQMVMGFKRDNQIDELFRLLFIKQCNTLNEILPGLFEKTNDYTELLLSVSVVDQDGVVYCLTHDIDEDDFNIEKGGQVEIIGWLYQYWNTEPKDAVFGRPSGQKIKKEEIPAATQLFTPDWIVRYMVENSLGRLFIDKRKREGIYADGRGLDEMTWEEAEAGRIETEKYIAGQMGWKYYLPEAEQTREVREQLDELQKEYEFLDVKDIKVIDPCMGSGHILCYLFDVLMQIYESQGYSRRDAAQNIMLHNLHGLDIDKRATQLAYFSVMMKARQYDRRFFSRNLQPMVYCTAWDEDGENFGSLVMVDDPGEMPTDPQMVFEFADYEERLNVWNYRCLLAQKYHVVCTNPPYMAVSNGNGKLQDYVKKNFPDSKADLFACFIEYYGQLAGKNGYQAMITQHAWMFLSSFEKLRAKLQAVDTVNMAHLGPRAFEEIGGEVVQTTSFVMRKSHTGGYKGTYCRLIEPTTQQGKEEMFLSRENRYTAQQDNFSKIPGAPMAYWLSNNFLGVFDYPKLSEIGETREGITTANNDLFLKLWFEIGFGDIEFHCQSQANSEEIEKKWFPHHKGGEYRKWFGNFDYVIFWYKGGEAIRGYTDDVTGRIRSHNYNLEYNFREYATWSRISSENVGLRYSPQGFIFDSASAGLFLPSQFLKYGMGFICSKVAKPLLLVLNPTIKIQPGDVADLPLAISQKQVQPVTDIVNNNITISKADWDSFETSWDFKRHPLVEYRHSVSKAQIDPDWNNMSYYLKAAYEAWEYQCQLRFDTLKANEEELNRIFIDIYGLQDELTPEVEDKDVTVRRANLGRDVRSLLSYAVGCMFGGTPWMWTA